MILDKLLEAKATLVKVSPLKTLNTRLSLLASLKQTCYAIAKETKNREVKNYLSRMHNKTDSLIGGLSTQDYGLEDTLAFKCSALNRLNSLIELEQAKPSDRVKIKAADEYDSEEDGPVFETENINQNTPEEQRKINQLLKNDQVNKETIESYQNEGRSLNELISKKFIVARKPIVPLFHPPIHPDALANAGFNVDRIGFYPILKRQLVLGINIRYSIVVKQETKKTVTQLAEHIVKLLSKQAHTPYYIMGPSTKHKTGFYFWLMSARDANQLKKVTIKKPDGTLVRLSKVVVKSWDFAFSSLSWHTWDRKKAEEEKERLKYAIHEAR